MGDLDRAPIRKGEKNPPEAVALKKSLDRALRLQEAVASVDQNKCIEALSEASIKDLRCKRDLLSDALARGQDEMHGRTGAFCEYDQKSGYYKINYQNVSSACEYGVGLGEFMPNECTKIEVVNEENEKCIGVRGVREKDDRPCFFVEGSNPPDYLETFSGWLWKPLTVIGGEQLKIQEAQIATALASHQASLARQEAQMATFAKGEVQMTEVGGDEKLVDSGDIAQVAKAAQDRVRQPQKFKVNTYDEVVERRGKDVCECIKYACKDIGVPLAVVFAHCRRETRFVNGDIRGDKDLRTGPSVGICQFQKGTWDFVMKLPYCRSAVSKVFPGQSFDRGENVLVDLIAIASFFRYHAGKGGIELSYSILPSPGQLAFLRGRAKGHKDPKSLMVAVANGDPVEKVYVGWLRDVNRFQNSIPPEFSGLEVVKV